MQAVTLIQKSILGIYCQLNYRSNSNMSLRIKRKKGKNNLKANVLPSLSNRMYDRCSLSILISFYCHYNNYCSLLWNENTSLQERVICY